MEFADYLDCGAGHGRYHDDRQQCRAREVDARAEAFTHA